MSSSFEKRITIFSLASLSRLISSDLNGTATFFAPMPRKPPTPITAASTVPFLSISRSLMLPTVSFVGPPTLAPMRFFEASHCSLPCSAMKPGLACSAVPVVAVGAGACALGKVGVGVCANAGAISSTAAAVIMRDRFSMVFSRS